MDRPTLTVGMATFDDADGVFFTIQALRLYHAEVMAETEFVVIDNNPDSQHGAALREFMPKVKNGRLIPFKKKVGTSVRNEIFVQARGEFVMSIDCHVLLLPGSLDRLLKFYKGHRDTQDLYQGPMQYDELEPTGIATHFDPKWQAEMYGVWGHDSRGDDPNGPPFEIQMNGLGLFTCRREAWLGFNPLFKSFGGEEGYIHEKYRKAGRKCWCLPFLRWVHKFIRPNGIRYPNVREDRMFNYFVGWSELGLDESPIIDHFCTVHPRAGVLEAQKKAHAAVAARQTKYTTEELLELARQTAGHLISLAPAERAHSLEVVKQGNEALFALTSYELAKLQSFREMRETGQIIRKRPGQIPGVRTELSNAPR